MGDLKTTTKTVIELDPKESIFNGRIDLPSGSTVFTELDALVKADPLNLNSIQKALLQVLTNKNAYKDPFVIDITVIIRSA